MGAQLSTLTGVLKELYEGKMRKQLNEEVVGLQRIERSSNGIESTVGGKYVTFPIHVGRNSGIGARQEMETLPTAGQQKTTSVRIGLKYLYGMIAMSGQTYELADKNYQTFISAMDLEMNGIKDDLGKDQNRQVYGDGTGNLGAATGANTGAVVPVADAQYFQEDMVVDSYTAANLIALGNPKQQGLIVLSVDTTVGANTVTFTTTPSPAIASTDVFVRTGNANREWTGLKGMVNNSGIYENVNSATYGVWKSVVDSPGADRNISEGAILANVDKVRKNGGTTSLLLTTLGVRAAYFALVSQLRQFVNTTEFTGGFKGLAFTTDKGDIPLVSDVDGTAKTIWGLSEKNITIYRDADWAYADRDGSMWDRLPTKDGYEARLFQYSELATDRRNAHFKMDRIIEAAT